jgi:hypothetical protein
MMLAVSVILAAVGSSAMATGTGANFEDVTLPAQGYYNGSDGAGGFISGSVTFNNTYIDDGTFTSWGGWAASQTADNTTNSYLNQYSAVTGKAQSGSNYGVAYVNTYTELPTITLAQPAVLGQAYFTNTTYAYLTMRDGDPNGWGKQFGGPSGTDPDWFLLTLTGKDEAGRVTGRILFYLADFRSANPADHFIRKDWTAVDLTHLGTVKTVEFTLTSSDTDEILGMYTPAYFAMDTLTLQAPPTVALAAPADGLVAGQGWSIALAASTTNGSPAAVTAVEFFDNGTKIPGAGGAPAGGLWTWGWDTTSAAFGVHRLTAKATDSDGLTGTSNIGSVTIRIPADGNGDNIVDGEDYGIWQNGYQHPGPSFLTGDYNGDGIVDGEDYGVWQNNYNRTAAADDVVAASSADAASGPMSGGSAPRLIAMTPASGAVATGVTSMTMVFDSDVQVVADAVEVSGLATGPHPGYTAAYDAATKTLTLTWAAALPADRYTVRLVADFIVGVGGGAALDGLARWEFSAAE